MGRTSGAEVRGAGPLPLPLSFLPSLDLQVARPKLALNVTSPRRSVNAGVVHAGRPVICIRETLAQCL